jgi:hypothetical protein
MLLQTTGFNLVNSSRNLREYLRKPKPKIKDLRKNWRKFVQKRFIIPAQSSQFSHFRVALEVFCFISLCSKTFYGRN